MMEADWLKAKDPEAMLQLIQPRFSPRRWHYLACAHVRRLSEFLPDGVLRQILEWAERSSGAAHTHPESARWREQIPEASQQAAILAAQAQRQIVLAADPDSDPAQFRTDESRRLHPSAFLFQGACQQAVNSIEEARTAMSHAGAAIQALISLRPGAEMLNTIRQEVVEATRVRANASIYATSALKLKTQGDEFADQNPSRKVNVQLAKAEGMVTEELDQVGNKVADQHNSKSKADRKALGKFLLELVGNPFKPYRFEPAWRTDYVLGMAKGIHEERAFDRMAILADALLDADCDEEAILRHCRGTEQGNEGAPHIRGCWVIDLILELEPTFYSHSPLTFKAPAPAPRNPVPESEGNWVRLLEALQRDALVDPDEDE